MASATPYAGWESKSMEREPSWRGWLIMSVTVTLNIVCHEFYADVDSRTFTGRGGKLQRKPVRSA
jgi:hypothetical protein